VVDGMSEPERQNVGDALLERAQDAALRAGYLTERAYPCSQAGHDAAVKRGNKALTFVRQALGFHITKPLSF
jgi:hypothetical protein